MVLQPLCESYAQVKLGVRGENSKPEFSYSSSHNHGWVENGCISNGSFPFIYIHLGQFLTPVPWFSHISKDLKKKKKPKNSIHQNCPLDSRGFLKGFSRNFSPSPSMDLLLWRPTQIWRELNQLHIPPRSLTNIAPEKYWLEDIRLSYWVFGYSSTNYKT